MTPKFDLHKHTARLLMNEPFFAALSRRIEKRMRTDIPTAGVTVDKESGQFVLYYNPDFMAALPDNEKLGVLKHEFYHLVFEHVTGRLPPGGLTKMDNICMDLAINSHLVGDLPDMCCMPGVAPFEWAPPMKSYEWYKAHWPAGEDEEGGEGEPGKGEGGEGEGEPGSFDDHSEWGEADATTQDIARERLKDAVKKAATEADRAGSWGSVGASTREEIRDRITTKVDWRKVLRYFIKTSQRANKRSTVRRINKRFPYIHPGKKVQRTAKIAISIDQSGSVSADMLAMFYSELDKLASLAEFTVIPFDTDVAETKVYVWKKGERRKAERVLCGGTCFDAPTKYVNERKFDGHIILTDLMAPKPVASACQRMWMTTADYARRPYFETNERVIAVD